MSMSVKEATAVLQAERDREYREKCDAVLKYVGRFFKYRNCYSCPVDESEYWWLYAQATVADDWGNLTGWGFQTDKDGKVEIDRQVTLYIGNGWNEITAAEFWAAARSCAQSVASRLAETAV